MERASTNGAELEYEVSGTGEPVFFIHGVLIADAFRPLLTEPSLAGRYRFIHYHRRGYAGSTPVAGSIGIDQQAADCRALLRHLKVDRAHVVAHSYGGAIALQLALDAPAVVQSLTLLEPALIVGASGQGYRDSLARGTERYRDAGAAIIVDEFLEARWPAYRAVLDRALPDAFAQAVADAATTFEYEVPALLDWHFGETEARRILQPTLSLLGGENDAPMSRFGETHRLLLAWLPRAEGVVLPGVTHLMQIENPRGTAEALAAFLARHPIH
jgi:pimeloyl-ACP methyl ester carboxylesterase